MECPNCGRWAPMDPGTGYDANDLCPRCKDDGWAFDADGELINLEEPDAPDAGEEAAWDR